MGVAIPLISAIIGAGGAVYSANKAEKTAKEQMAQAEKLNVAKPTLDTQEASMKSDELRRKNAMRKGLLSTIKNRSTNSGLMTNKPAAVTAPPTKTLLGA